MVARDEDVERQRVGRGGVLDEREHDVHEQLSLIHISEPTRPY